MLPEVPLFLLFLMKHLSKCPSSTNPASETFRILAYSALCFSGICWHIQSYSVLLRHIHTYWDIIKPHSGLFRHIQHPVYTPHIPSLALFWVLAYLEPETYLKPCEMLNRHIQNPAIGYYSVIFRHFQNLVQCLQMQKPGILQILEFSEPFHNCIPIHIQNTLIFMKIYEHWELCDIFKTWHIFRTFQKFKIDF